VDTIDNRAASGGRVRLPHLSGLLVGTVVGAGISLGALLAFAVGGSAAWLVNLVSVACVSVLVGVLVVRIRRGDARFVQLLDEQRAQAVQAAEDRGALSRELSRRVNEDVLTGLANRTAFVEMLRRRLLQMRPLAILFIDLDDFKKVNDTLGHTVGDELLACVAERLREGSRDSDVVARFGGDEFAVMLVGLAPADAFHVGQRMLNQLKTPFHLCGRTVTVRASGGLAVSFGDLPEDPDAQVVELLRQADLAMYTSKAEHTHGITVFHEGMQSDIMDRLALESDLHRALGTTDIGVVYQPIVDLEADDIVGVEALLRWKHPTRGQIPPTSFIPVAEQTGLIVPLTLWVVRQACMQLREWDASPETRGLSMAINISGRLVLEPGIGSAVARELYHAGIDPHRVVLEITESLLMEDRPQAIQTLCQLRALGMRLSVDDFGTGYSSLSRLNTLPIDEVKIDKSFIAQLGDDGPGDTIVRATVAMAHGLGLRVVAEGVESAAQLKALREVACDEAQGYRFGRPVPPEQVGDVISVFRRADAVVHQMPSPRTGVHAAADAAGTCQQHSAL
jgi:diguanylate cyclase (GGDEF)-like protein